MFHADETAIIYPIHPRTMKRLKEFGLEVPEGMISKETNWENPFGDGNAGNRIVEMLI